MRFCPIDARAYYARWLLGSTTADAAGSWSLVAATPFTVGGHSLTAKAIDAAGNTSAMSAAKTVTIDTTAPTLPAITGLRGAVTGPPRP